MNPKLLETLCLLITIGAVVAGFMDKITWLRVGFIIAGTFVAAIINGRIIAGRINRQFDDPRPIRYLLWPSTRL